ncbi:hypothetical protein EYA84_02050 [Verrucosispora sp. SN26_14.1]|uniref:hypothetical protein n=1 Tax=Verrucosispora sp. SN26_14.1 TaxID=2527879 RepID=UPI0010353841|nr:hypothetical protein [Verrucosispora sp. SN26_14.1]TBL44248.1 hypothetical protein EYA84_02050 [Verrucosispora sp. SN26_14.1]
MPDLFTLEQLASYMQQDLDLASATLARLLATTLIRNEIGGTRYDALTDLSPLLPVALDVARRLMDPQKGLQSSTRQVDDYRETDTYVTGSPGAPALTADERDRVLKAVGLSPSGAFTIRPGAPARPVRGCGEAARPLRW